MTERAAARAKPPSVSRTCPGQRVTNRRTSPATPEYHSHQFACVMNPHANVKIGQAAAGLLMETYEAAYWNVQNQNRSSTPAAPRTARVAASGTPTPAETSPARRHGAMRWPRGPPHIASAAASSGKRSEEHTSEL